MLAMIQRIEEQDDKIRKLQGEIEEREQSVAGSWQI